MLAQEMSVLFYPVPKTAELNFKMKRYHNVNLEMLRNLRAAETVLYVLQCI